MSVSEWIAPEGMQGDKSVPQATDRGLAWVVSGTADSRWE